MKTIPAVLVIVLVCTKMYTVQAQDFLSDFDEKWKNARNYTLEVVDSLPEDALDFIPTDGMMSAREQLEHIQKNILWLGGTYLFADTTGLGAKYQGLSKREIHTKLGDTFEAVSVAINKLDEAQLNEEVQFFPGIKSRRQMLVLINDHLTHHRGQLIVYLRLSGASAPRYRGW